ncbi:hypothetical protein E5288_WYG003961 [Bos mutus]|uniref:Neural proliferation differentiation and control protein 1 n=1 Tax=Bos mutus TaxID=72004 RepID=A0A6B0SDA2_9CETA|nr:hypothetical protein [Bos mutus]
MYHYQHQRQQMRCLERHKEPPKELDSASSDEENEDGDFTVYECPGLAPPLQSHAALTWAEDGHPRALVDHRLPPDSSA